MSAFGPQRTSAVALHMSAFDSKRTFASASLTLLAHTEVGPPSNSISAPVRSHNRSALPVNVFTEPQAQPSMH